MIENYKFDILMILLCTFTVIVWILPILNPFIFLLLFVYFFLSKKPISWYIVVTIFSITSYYFDRVFLVDYLLTVILFFIVLLKKPVNKFIWGKIGILLGIYGGYALISVIWSFDRYASLIGCATLIQGVLGYFIIMNSGIKLKRENLITVSKIAMYFMLTITIEILFYYLTSDYVSVFRQKNVNLSWAKNNYIGFFYCIAIPISLYKYTHNNKFYYFYFLLDFINIIGLILTLSRGAYIGAGVGILIFILVNFNFRMMLKYGLPTVIVSGLLYLLEGTRYYIHALFTKFPRVSFLDDTGRFKLWEIAFDSFKERPIIGNGYYSGYFILPQHDVNNWWFHNLFLDVAASLGVIGLILVTLIIIQFLLHTFKPKDAFLISIFAGLTAFLTQSFLDIGFNYWTAGFVMYVIVALGEIYQKSTYKL